MTFNDLNYTRTSLTKQLGLVELHAADGSATEAGCQCIQEKHLLLIEGLAEEGTTIATNPTEKEYYKNLADYARQQRKKILEGKFDNPSRKYEPHGLTEQEASDKAAAGKCTATSQNRYCRLVRCIKKVEASGTAESPTAVCRASIYGHK